MEVQVEPAEQMKLVPEKKWKDRRVNPVGEDLGIGERVLRLEEKFKYELQGLHDAWAERCKDILSGTPPERPPLRAVNHSIPLIDEKMAYNYYLPRCADAFKGAFLEKMNCYIANGWWEPAAVPQAAPMMCTPKNKQDNRLRTVLDS
jgi:hypothetical protein